MAGPEWCDTQEVRGAVGPELDPPRSPPARRTCQWTGSHCNGGHVNFSVLILAVNTALLLLQAPTTQSVVWGQRATAESQISPDILDYNLWSPDLRPLVICDNGDGPLRHYTKWNELKKDTYCMSSLIWGNLKEKKKKPNLIGKAIRFMVTRSGGR